MQLPLLTQPTAVQRFAASAQAAISSVLDFAEGTILRALAEAQAALGLWFQFQALLVLATTRLSSSQADDVDTWVADFGLTRLPAISAAGIVTLARYAPTTAALVVPYVNADGSINTAGAQIKTTDGTQVFWVTTDPTNAAWSATAGASPGYYLAAGVPSVSAPVVAAVAGAGGNIQTGTLTLLASGMSGIDTANNAAPFTTGIAAETDAALKVRFVSFIRSLSRGTIAAYQNAIASLQQNLVCQVVPGLPAAGSVTVYVDDGTGAPPASTITTAYTACDAVRGATANLFVLPVTALPVSIGAVLVYVFGANQQAAIANVSAAIASYVLSLPLAGTLSYPRLTQVILGADPGVADIATLTVAGATASVSAPTGQRIELGTLTVA